MRHRVETHQTHALYTKDTFVHVENEIIVFLILPSSPKQTKITTRKQKTDTCVRQIHIHFRVF